MQKAKEVGNARISGDNQRLNNAILELEAYERIIKQSDIVYTNLSRGHLGS